MTNGEYLRSLSDEELGKRLCDLFGGCNVCVASEHCSMGHNGIVAWIKEESDVLPFDRQNSQMTCKDCVSRQSAIDAVSRGCLEFRGIFAECEKNLNELPPAQPEIIRCKDCKHSEFWYRDKRRCFLWHEEGIDVFEDGFCNYAERKNDDDGRDQSADTSQSAG